MRSRALVVASAAGHMAFLVLLVLGGFLAWWWPWMLWPHLICVGWAVYVVGLGRPCPLTEVERRGRERAGWPPMHFRGFIVHYFSGVLYPPSWYPIPVVPLAGLLVLVSWAGLVLG